MLKFAIVGFGALGKAHFKNTEDVSNRFEDVKLVAICDIDLKAFSSAVESNISIAESITELDKYNLYTDAEEMFEKEDLDFIITALPTYIHEKVAVSAMEKGIHVFSEKPMALTLEQAKNMIDKSWENNVKLMIGQCLRYFPEYVLLKKMTDNKEYGNVVRADFTRLSKTPDWSWQNWMLDEEKSGSAILDLHVHDVDFIHWVFGVPKSVTSVVTNSKAKHDSITTIYDFGDDKIITAKADWGYPASYPFTAIFSVRFERATVELKSDGLWLYEEKEDPRKLEVEKTNGYVEEIVDFINCIKNDKISAVNPPEASMTSLRIALAERKSADTNKPVVL